MSAVEAGHFVATPMGFGFVCLKWGSRVRVGFSDGKRATFEAAECVPIEQKPASVTMLADYRRKS